MFGLRWNKEHVCVCAFCWKNMGLTALFTDAQKSYKHRFQYKFGSHSIIHTFKNYFATVFSIFSNKQYPNRPLVSKTLG